MNIIVCSSRGKSLRSLNKREDTVVRVVPGGRIGQLVDIAKEELNKILTKPNPKFVYFVAGLPDTTTKIYEEFWMNDELHAYEEVIFSNTPENIIGIINSAAQDILAENAIPIFSTIVPCHLSIWNHTRLSQHKTSHLLHYKNYDLMQEQQLETIREINSYILHINSQNRVATPKLAKPVYYRRGNSWRFRFGKLADGVHATDKLKKVWHKTVNKILNRNLLDRDLEAILEQHQTSESEADSDEEADQ